MAFDKTMLVAWTACALTLSTSTSAGEMAIPIPLQAKLLAKVVGYDRSFQSRSGDKASVVILVKDDADSKKAGGQMQAALAAMSSIGGLPPEISMLNWSNAAAVADTCRAKKASILYLAPGFEKDTPAIVASLGSQAILTVAAESNYVPKGIIVGFDLISGKPKLLVHIGQARKQQVALKADLLKLVKVFE